MHTADEIADAKQRVSENQKQKIALLATLASYGDKSAATTLRTMIATMKATGALSAEQIAALNVLLAKLDAVEAQANQTTAALHRTSSLLGGGKGTASKPGRAGGGPVFAGQAYDVGESGRERLVMLQGGGGYVIPYSGSSASGYAGAGSGALSGGSSATTNITINNPQPRAAEDDVARTMRRLQVLGAA